MHKNIQGFPLKRSFQFFFFLHDLKKFKIIIIIVIMAMFVKRNPLNISFWGSVFFPILIPS